MITSKMNTFVLYMTLFGVLCFGKAVSFADQLDFVAADFEVIKRGKISASDHFGKPGHSIWDIHDKYCQVKNNIENKKIEALSDLLGGV